MDIVDVKETNFQKFFKILKNSEFLKRTKYVRYRLCDKEFVYIIIHRCRVNTHIREFFENITIGKARPEDCFKTRDEILERGVSILKYIYEKRPTYIEFDLEREEDLKNFIVLLRLINFLKNRFDVNIANYKFKNGIVIFYINEERYLIDKIGQGFIL